MATFSRGDGKSGNSLEAIDGKRAKRSEMTVKMDDKWDVEAGISIDGTG
jgi:hypothetical protein